MTKTKVLMVCLGNICRSPLAEGILQSKVNTDKVMVDSAGTAGYHIGHLPDERSIAVAKKNGLDITNQRCRQFRMEDFDIFDHIYVMDQSNFQNVLKLARTTTHQSKVKLILNESFPGKNMEVPDPYYDGDKGFDRVYNMLDHACTIVADKL
ncbi:low molecular weight protein-tyrosine-phosphatase [Spongiivirga sp. MCCC 1A20706]|uniref:low molecular weight protein-tyrosine-phosphatase n=1 Tax=Spongiivirga sp. MCCC 1A20706 TaxID=3160963 RepID=UPI003977E427